MPRTDYVGGFGGMDLGLSCCTDKGHFWMMDFSIDAGAAHQNFKTSRGWILDNDNLVHYALYFDYGRIVSKQEHSRLFPFVGLGIQSYEFHEGYDDDEDYPFKGGFSVNAGTCFDWSFRSRHHEGKMSVHGLRFKPSAAITFYNAPLKMVPSLNVAVCYCFGSVSY